MTQAQAGVSVVIPSFKVKAHILGVIAGIGAEVDRIIIVDDACPEGCGGFVLANCKDPRVVVLTHTVNQGVGGAVITGYIHAVEQGALVVVKLDGDGQMDPALIGDFIGPILDRRADYAKGNRFFNIEDVRQMPGTRLIGNALLSFATKGASGYWNLFDPANGYTAISAAAISHLPLSKLSRRYFFESDLLFRLGTLRARVVDVPMTAIYGEEISNVSLVQAAPLFLAGALANALKRLFYNYVLRDFSVATLELIIGAAALAFGIIFGSLSWAESARAGTTSSTGTVMLAALPVILGVQLLLSFLSYDMGRTPTEPAFASPVRGRHWRAPHLVELVEL